jgi:flagellar biosynthesis chaperone FliJ
LSLPHSCTRCTHLNSTLAGTSENVALLKARREVNEKDKMLTKLQTKLDIQADALKQLQATVQSSEQALHEKRLEAATLTSKLRDAELNQRSRSLLGGGVEEHLSRIEQLEAENKVLHQAQADMARAAMSGEQEQHHQRQRDALGAKIKQLQGQVPDEQPLHFRHRTFC